MAVNEVIVTGRVKRRLIDKTAKLWQRISYWTKASDVELDDGKTVETVVNEIIGNIKKTTIITSTLYAGSTQVMINSNISNNDDVLVDIYTPGNNISPKDISFNNGTFTLTFKAQKEDIQVALKLTRI